MSNNFMYSKELVDRTELAKKINSAFPCEKEEVRAEGRALYHPFSAKGTNNAHLMISGLGDDVGDQDFVSWMMEDAKVKAKEDKDDIWTGHKLTFFRPPDGIIPKGLILIDKTYGMKPRQTANKDQQTVASGMTTRHVAQQASLPMERIISGESDITLAPRTPTMPLVPQASTSVGTGKHMVYHSSSSSGVKRRREEETDLDVGEGSRGKRVREE